MSLIQHVVRGLLKGTIFVTLFIALYVAMNSMYKPQTQSIIHTQALLTNKIYKKFIETTSILIILLPKQFPIPFTRFCKHLAH